jgi:hypothetical protein
MKATMDMVIQSYCHDLLFDYVGPLIDPLALQGPLVLNGWKFLVTVASTMLVMFYLLLVGRFAHIGRGGFAFRDLLRFLATMPLIFLPPFIRLGIKFWSA